MSYEGSLQMTNPKALSDFKMAGTVLFGPQELDQIIVFQDDCCCFITNGLAIAAIMKCAFKV